MQRSASKHSVDKIFVIVNPAARGEKARSFVEKIRKLSRTAVLATTSAPGEARTLAKQAAADGFRVVVAAGGDGTVNDVVNGIAGTTATLGVLPIGTMNVYATELGLPANNLRACWELILEGHTRTVDLPKANGHYFVQLAGIGFDAQIVEETSWDFKKTLGPLSYVISATQIAARKPPLLKIEHDHGTTEGSFILIGNGRHYGGPFSIFKDAKIDDGLLDMLVFKNLGYLDIVRYLHGIIFGTHTRLKDVTYFQTHKASVTSDERVPVEVDGEVIGQLPMKFRFSSRKLRVIAPKKATP
jgi:YegS/Rv2252/BmrU family lipid kinase